MCWSTQARCLESKSSNHWFHRIQWSSHGAQSNRGQAGVWQLSDQSGTHHELLSRSCCARVRPQTLPQAKTVLWIIINFLGSFAQDSKIWSVLAFIPKVEGTYYRLHIKYPMIGCTSCLCLWFSKDVVLNMSIHSFHATLNRITLLNVALQICIERRIPWIWWLLKSFYHTGIDFEC